MAMFVFLSDDPFTEAADSENTRLITYFPTLSKTTRHLPEASRLYSYDT